MSQVSTFLSYSTGDRARILAAAVLLLSLSAGIAVGPFARIRGWLLWFGDLGEPIVPGNPTSERIAGAVKLIDRSLPGTRTCLVRSLTTETLLRLYGYEPEHRIGVDKTGESEMKAHSWLVHEGEILIGDLDDLSRYEVLRPLDPGDRS